MPRHPIAAYLRVSSKMQAEDRSVQAQRDEIERWLAYKRIAPIDVKWYMDEGHTGRDMSRPAFIEMTEAIERGDHTTIVAWDISRISRGFNAQPIMWLERLDQLDVRLVLLEVGVDTSTAWGRFFMRFQWLQACLFSDLKGEEWKRVIRRRKEKGLPTGGALRWGDTTERDRFILEMHRANPEMSNVDIALEVGRKFDRKPPSRSTIQRAIQRAIEQERQDEGAA